MNSLFSQGFRQTILSIAVTLCVLSFCAACVAEETPADDMISVQGTGYPPIRAESPAQAHLMARRAAVVNAYRNALAPKTLSGNGSDVAYEELSGFVRGMVVVEEEYLKDGGVRITARVPIKNVAVTPGSRIDTRRDAHSDPRINTQSDSRRPEAPREVSGGPERVSLDEWYKIINKLVRIDK